ncbi:hypothetical protein FNV43_RR04389 [Rhamnella rubrinervis]|uniref:Uncharacterized protein n=1 Tax=Rhamnella rubrinervis TaxID=2594499 RepID=A0A8K0HKX9_9ROSA|nr:hypothetical protein FNV43_RR04389 [Rhamnella rubrinervis]
MASFDSAWEMPRKGNFGILAFSPDLARGIGIPLKFDHSTIIGNYGHYARVLAQPIRSTTPFVPTTNALESIIHLDLDLLPPNRHQYEAGKSIQTTSEGDRTPSHHSTVPRQVTSWANAFGDSGDEPEDDDFVNDFGEDEWPPLQGEGSSKPSNELDDTPYTGRIKHYGHDAVKRKLDRQGNRRCDIGFVIDLIILVMPSRHGLSRTTNPLRLADSAGGLALGGDVLECLIDMLNMGT